jgi:hypothetical protein
MKMLISVGLYNLEKRGQYQSPVKALSPSIREGLINIDEMVVKKWLVCMANKESQPLLSGRIKVAFHYYPIDLDSI